MNLAEQLERNENEIIVAFGDEDMEEYLEKQMGIIDHEIFSEYCKGHARHLIIATVEGIAQPDNPIEMLQSSFMMGFIMGHRFALKDR